MSALELSRLFKNSRLAQVAQPLLKDIRQRAVTPTHQTIFTPKSSAIRSQFGLKTSLPRKIGYSYIAFNDIDNYKSMPDVEKCTSKMYTRLRFQESGLVLRSPFAKHNPLFQGSSFSNVPASPLLDSFNLAHCSISRDANEALLAHPELHGRFKRFVAEKHPQMLLGSKASDTAFRDVIAQFLREHNSTATKRPLLSLARDLSQLATAQTVQGTAGLSYAQKGKLQNSPNGIKYGAILPGRLIGGIDATIGGFVASVNDRRNNMMQNYASNYPGKCMRQFTSPFKVLHAELTENGGVRMQADSVKTGTWDRSRSFDSIERSSYQPSNPEFRRASERVGLDKLDRLLKIIG